MLPARLLPSGEHTVVALMWLHYLEQKTKA